MDNSQKFSTTNSIILENQIDFLVYKLLRLTYDRSPNHRSQNPNYSTTVRTINILIWKKLVLVYCKL